MNSADIVTVVETAVDELPENVQFALEDVEVIVATSHRDEVLPDEHTFPADFKGCYIGTTVVGSEEPDEITGEVKQPVGVIYLNAENLADQDEVHRALYHEIGHALGLSEEDVANLGLADESSE